MLTEEISGSKKSKDSFKDFESLSMVLPFEEPEEEKAED